MTPSTGKGSVPDMIARYLVYTACGETVTADNLARRFGITRRTLTKYVAVYNRRAEYPIDCSAGRNGGYKLTRMGDAGTR